MIKELFTSLVYYSVYFILISNLYQFRSRASCLSFDMLNDKLGPRSGYPLTAYVVAGTQAEQGKKNSLVVMKLSNLQEEKEEGQFNQLSII